MKLFKSVALLLCVAFNAQASSWVEETVGGEHDYTQEFDWGYVTLICGDQQSADWDVKMQRETLRSWSGTIRPGVGWRGVS